MTITLLGTEHCWKLPFCRSQLFSIVEKMSQIAGLKAVELYLVQDTTMSLFNFKYMSCHGITNILSFPMDDSLFAGSIVLSVDTFNREALLYRQDISIYCLSLLAHGIGHLSGYEHSHEMNVFCEKILTRTLL